MDVSIIPEQTDIVSDQEYRIEKFHCGGKGGQNEELVYRELGLPSHRLENMSRCRAVFERYTESYPESWARKIIWAYWKLEEEGKPICWTNIRKISGVKKKNMQVVIPYLKRHTGDDTMNKIMALLRD